MAWKKTDALLMRRLTQYGLTEMVEAGLLCQKAEELLPNLFRAVSVKNNILHLEIPRSQVLHLKMREGWLMDELNTFSLQKGLPLISHIRLTFTQL